MATLRNRREKGLITTAHDSHSGSEKLLFSQEKKNESPYFSLTELHFLVWGVGGKG